MMLYVERRNIIIIHLFWLRGCTKRKKKLSKKVNKNMLR